MQGLKKYQPWLIITLLFLILFNGCGMNAHLNAVQKKIEALQAQTISGEAIKEIIKTTPALETMKMQEMNNAHHNPIIQIIEKKTPAK